MLKLSQRRMSSVSRAA